MCHHHVRHHEHHHHDPWWYHHIHPRMGLPLRGLLHLVILKTLTEKPMRGIDLKNVIKEKFGVDVPSAAIYVVLKNLEEKGLVYSKWEKDQSGSPVKLYEITGEGKEYLKEKARALKSVKELIDYLAEKTE